MNRKLMFLSTLIALALAPLSCVVPEIADNNQLLMYANFNQLHWDEEEQRIGALDCDITSVEAAEYRQCLLDEALNGIKENISHMQTTEYWRARCREEYLRIPGCSHNLFGSGTVRYACDVGHEAEGTYNDERCPLGHSVQLNIIVNWDTREFAYHFDSRCVDDVLDFVYDYIRTELERSGGGGIVTDNGWLLGAYQLTYTRSYECGPPRFCGNTGSAPDTEVSESTTYVVGRLAASGHLEMGFQNQSYPMDPQTIGDFNSWLELENAYRGSKVYDCYLGN